MHDTAIEVSVLTDPDTGRDTIGFAAECERTDEVYQYAADWLDERYGPDISWEVRGLMAEGECQVVFVQQ